ncbi:glycosyltransferase family 2 protein [Kocuria sp.]|uniref:glycosyltransferase family 2 protein n=1 Tax=Kocuria sp. TaxID=1871328 RepID=UPI0026DEB4CD|nr:glycosyltransferase [Kocuria sp.]MDO5618394.1 glycosyltransferase [Kocuria sp.]
MEFGNHSQLKPGTTVLVVGYNHQAYIGETLKSISQQTLPAAAVLITDDASPGQSETARVVYEYLAKAPKTWQWLPQQKNKGLNATLNSLLDMVDTEFVTYIAADDTMLDHRIEVHTNLLQNSSPTVGLAYSDAQVINELSEVIAETSRTEFPWPDEPQRTEETLRCLVKANWIPAASLFMRTSTLRAVGGYAEDLFYEDFELLLRMAKDHPFVYADEPLVQVRRLATSLGAQGFVSDSPRFLRASYVALGHAISPADPRLRAQAQALRWNLAKRAVTSNMPRREALAMLWNARSGAKTPLHAHWHLIQGLIKRP